MSDYKFQKEVIIRGKTYTVRAPSTTMNKKYDVWLNHKKILSFGDINYQHFRDRIGYYKSLNHLNPIRLKLYQARHKYDIGVVKNDPNYPGYWSMKFLWM